MQNFVNNNYKPGISYYSEIQDPSQNESFNKATHPANKPIISKHIFAIDSRQRNYNFYPNANSYNINIPDRYKNVTGIELKAAMLPRTEYNVNSSNKYLDVLVGDYISKITVINNNNKSIITINGEEYAKNNSINNVPLIISPPSLSGSHIVSEQAVVEVDLYPDSTIKSYNIINAGSGYSYTNPPRITLGDFSNFRVSIGRNYIAELREGQYTIGGNPQFTNNATSTSLQSWVPSHLLCEIESAISYSILKDNVSTASEYCYTRKPWAASASTAVPEDSTTDYPLLFTSRLMSQYPDISTYSDSVSSSRILPNQYETNACKYNRIYTTNCLVFKSNELPVGTFSDDEGFTYDILTYDTINMGVGINQYILYCKLMNPLQQVSGKFWTGLSSTDTTYKHAHWEYLFASGTNYIVNSASLMGYSKKNYNMSTNNIAIEVQHVNPTSETTLIPRGLSYTADNDYYLVGDPEYVTLSFRSSSGGGDNSMNDRVDSQDNSNIDRVFACLIFDTVQPAVLQDVSSGKIDTTIGSLGYDNNNLNSFMNYDNTLSEVKQLTGNTGSQNTSYNRPPGQLKAMKGSDFDKKAIEFPQPIAKLSSLSIRFTKFSQLYGQGSDSELYDFHGKEHLLLFEITCGDLMTGRRF